MRPASAAARRAVAVSVAMGDLRCSSEVPKTRTRMVWISASWSDYVRRRSKAPESRCLNAPGPPTGETSFRGMKRQSRSLNHARYWTWPARAASPAAAHAASVPVSRQGGTYHRRADRVGRGDLALDVPAGFFVTPGRLDFAHPSFRRSRQQSAETIWLRTRTGIVPF